MECLGFAALALLLTSLKLALEKPRRGGLFIARAAQEPSFLLFFSGASLAPLKNKRKINGGHGVGYKQATPPGFSEPRARDFIGDKCPAT